MLDALSYTSLTVSIGEQWIMRVFAKNADGTPSAIMPTGVVTLPTDGTAALEMLPGPDAGCWYAIHVPTEPGRHLAHIESADGSADFTAQAVGPTPNADMPTPQDYTDRYGIHSHADTLVQQILDQEFAAQFKVCRIPAAYPEDLRGALLRRTNRVLAMLALPLAVRESAEGESQIVVPGRDPEVQRLERPWRRLPIG